MEYLWSFIFCGLICSIAQLIYNSTKLTAGHITSLFVVGGGLLECFGIYDYLLDFVGAGAYLPITSFGHSLVHSFIEGVKEGSYLQGLENLFSTTSAGIALAVFLAFIVALLFRSRT